MEELVKRLKDFAAELRKAEDALLVHDAADAIEELSKRVDESIPKDDAEIIIEELSKPKWIPVAERLPEKTGTYLAWMKWDLTEADEEPSAYPVLYDADAEGFGWWKSYYDGDTLGWAGEDFVRYEGITHWMPLPQPPEEGE